MRTLSTRNFAVIAIAAALALGSGAGRAIAQDDQTKELFEK